MTRGKKLPLFSELLPDPDAAAARPQAPPSVDQARRNLGGRGSTTADAGRIVALAGHLGMTVVGVVLFASDEEIDVWIDAGIVRRTHPAQAQPFQGTVADELVELASNVSRFAALREGQRVRYEVEKGTLADGAIVEKCRYGALVLREDGKLMAVGFRKLWPLVPDVRSPN